VVEPELADLGSNEEPISTCHGILRNLQILFCPLCKFAKAEDDRRDLARYAGDIEFAGRREFIGMQKL
jgi:hypothetical protein